ncbi:hypothetical protein GCM10008983_28100 [Lentibacillus halophilus]|uniref:Uncharacterized protein n=1 Tax=Lentibacillus halophilus TaxID=295065 RepID=A0ABN0ZI07_9BACI
MTGERAKIDAKASQSYIIYQNNEGRTVKEYYNGDIAIQDDSDKNE